MTSSAENKSAIHSWKIGCTSLYKTGAYSTRGKLQTLFCGNSAKKTTSNKNEILSHDYENDWRLTDKPRQDLATVLCIGIHEHCTVAKILVLGRETGFPTQI